METGYQGHKNPGDGEGKFGALLFQINQSLARVNTCTLVKIVSVDDPGGVAPVGFVSVKPLVNMVDGAGNGREHGLLHQLPYFRLQGGTNAVIINPAVGDIGIALFADKDISKVKKTKSQANPGSGSRHSMSDGLYIGGVLNGTPTQYIQFLSTGINIHSPVKITMDAPNIETTGTWKHTGAIENNNKNIGSTHRHPGVTIGAANTQAPI